MTTDHSSYEFQSGKTYEIAVAPGTDAVRVTHHGEGQLEPQDRYATLEFKSNVGSGPWREFRDWETESDVSINSHQITEVSEKLV